jgi:hypothetical protein
VANLANDFTFAVFALTGCAWITALIQLVLDLRRRHTRSPLSAIGVLLTLTGLLLVLIDNNKRWPHDIALTVASSALLLCLAGVACRVVRMVRKTGRSEGAAAGRP